MIGLFFMMMLGYGQDEKAQAIKHWVKSLSSDEIQIRERAEASLIEAGASAISEVFVLVSSDNAEVSARARKILKQIGSRTLLQIEESIARSKGLTVEFDFQVEHAGEMKARHVKGTIRVAPGDRILLETWEASGLSTGVHERQIVSDGKKTLIRFEGGQATTIPTVARPASAIAVLLVRAGLGPSLWHFPRMATTVLDEGKEDIHFSKLVRRLVPANHAVTDLSVRPGKDGPELVFSVTREPAEPPEDCKVVIGLDSRSLAPRSRTFELRRRERVYRGAETYSRWVEEEHKESTFEIPKD